MERENCPPPFRQSRASRLVAARDARSPLPEGEGEGEGERDAAYQNGRTNFASSTRPAPWVKVGFHIGRRACRWSKGARSQAHWCFERSFPLTPPSPMGRGRRARRRVANRMRWVVRLCRRGIAERTVPVGATPDLRKTQDVGPLSLRERARVRGNETQPTKTAGRILPAQLDRLPQSELAFTSGAKSVDGGHEGRRTFRK